MSCTDSDMKSVEKKRLIQLAVATSLTSDFNSTLQSEFRTQQ